MQNNIEIEGTEQIQAFYEAVAKDLVKKRRKILKEAGELNLNIMREEVPVSNINEPGYVHMKDDLAVSRVITNNQHGEHVEVGPRKGKGGTRWRLRFLTNGTKYMAPNDFMTRTYQRSQPTVQQYMYTELQKVLMLR